MHTVVETPRYQADAARLFTEDEQAAIIDLVASDPRWKHPQGARRVQWPRQARRCAADLLFGGDDLPVFLLAAFAKNERDDLTPTERSLMAKAVAAMLADYRRRQ